VVRRVSGLAAIVSDSRHIFRFSELVNGKFRYSEFLHGPYDPSDYMELHRSNEDGLKRWVAGDWLKARRIAPKALDCSLPITVLDEVYAARINIAIRWIDNRKGPISQHQVHTFATDRYNKSPSPSQLIGNMDKILWNGYRLFPIPGTSYPDYRQFLEILGRGVRKRPL
jgi:hypothetical protein